MTNRTLLVGAIAGAAAGMAMAGIEMINGWASSAHTAWDAPMGIWAYIAGLDHFGRPANHVWPILLGIGGHMMNAIFIGIVFVALMRILRNPPGALLLGTAFGVGLWALQRYVFLPINTPENKLFTTSMISPQWVWWVPTQYLERRPAWSTCCSAGGATPHKCHCCGTCPSRMSTRQPERRDGTPVGTGSEKVRRWLPSRNSRRLESA